MDGMRTRCERRTQSRRRRGLYSIVAALVACAGLLFTGNATAQETVTLRAAVKVAPPFVMKTPSGDFEGLTVDLWRRIAEKAGLRFKFVETDLSGLIDGVAGGQYDIGIGALTVTPDREERLDFTHSYYETGLAIAVRSAGSGFWQTLAGLQLGRVLPFVGALVLLLLIVGALFWFFERRRNPVQFDRRPMHGIGSGFWLAAVTMTTVGYGDKAPVSLAARFVALVWMFAALILVSIFTGIIASRLTVRHIEGSVKGTRDLVKVVVGSVPKTSSGQWLTENRIAFRHFASVEIGLKALADKKIDAFVYDAPLMKHLVKKRFGESRITILPSTFERQRYALALAPNSVYRERINVSLLMVLHSKTWRDLLFMKLGE